MPYTQSKRVCSLDCPLGPDALLLRSLNGSESVSGLFEFSLDLLSEDSAISPDAVLGEAAAIRLELADGSERYFHGVFTEFVQGGQDARFSTYHAVVRPWTWFLTRRAGCRIFQNLSVPDIVGQVFSDAGFQDFERRLTQTYAARVFCVQYRETDYQFVARLLEEEGIFFFFEHGPDAHTLILADAASALPDVPGNADVVFAGTGGGQQQRDEVLQWTFHQEIHTGKVSLKDYNFEDPSNPLSVRSPTLRSVGRNGTLETYDHHPCEYAVTGEGDGIAKKRMQEREIAAIRVHGAGNVRSFSAGHRFTLKQHVRSDQNDRPHMLVEVRHHLSQPSPVETGVDEDATYENVFTCVPTSEPYRPPLITPKPLIRGPQTALVVGPAGEEIYVDRYGRIKVQFHWDREGKRDENSSCWIRVSQAWAGKKWGWVAHPRIGDEVIVEFLEGDPDKPIVTGSVYNAETMPPYDLPANKTQTGLKSRSSMGGGPSNFNELRFEDKKGSEEVYIQAEKDKRVLVKNDRTENVGHDETITIGHDRTEKVGNNEAITIGVDRTEKVGNNETITIGVDRTEQVGSNESITIGANKTITVGANHTESIGAAMSLNVGSTKSENVALASNENVGAAKLLNVGGAYAINVGAAMNTAVAGAALEEVGLTKQVIVAGDYGSQAKKVTVEADDEITLKTGAASITLKKSGEITIEGTQVKVLGSALIDIKAALVKINS